MRHCRSEIKSVFKLPSYSETTPEKRSLKSLYHLVSKRRRNQSYPANIFFIEDEILFGIKNVRFNYTDADASCDQLTTYLNKYVAFALIYKAYAHFPCNTLCLCYLRCIRFRD